MHWVITLRILGIYLSTAPAWLLNVRLALLLQVLLEPLAEEFAEDEVLRDSQCLCLKQIPAEVNLKCLRPCHRIFVLFRCNLTDFDQQIEDRVLIVKVDFRIILSHDNAVGFKPLLCA